MNLIVRHISYLLLSCRKVAIPGLGTFSTKFESASFDAESKIFTPSKISIIYHSNCNDNSVILINSLSRKLNISSYEAEQMIKKFVATILSNLKRNHYCRLDSIGYLIDINGRAILKDTFWKHNKYPSSISLR